MITENQVHNYLSELLNKNTGGREHHLFAFYDSDLMPSAFWRGLSSYPHATFHAVDCRGLESQSAVLDRFYDPERNYLTIFDFCLETLYSEKKAAIRYAHREKGLDFMSFEFPRYGYTPIQIEAVLARVVACSPNLQLERANSFYEKLAENVGYTIDVLSGPDHTSHLQVKGPKSWMEIAGPLQEGDIRFAPGAELFYSGRDVSGRFHTHKGGLNLLPLRTSTVTQDTLNDVGEFTRLGARLREEPLELFIENGKVTGLESRTSIAKDFKKLMDKSQAFYNVVEVGLGLSHAAAPIIYDWASTTNEAVAGIHIGLGADPGQPDRFDTNIHLDFVINHADIRVNGEEYFRNGTFA